MQYVNWNERLCFPRTFSNFDLKIQNQPMNMAFTKIDEENSVVFPSSIISNKYRLVQFYVQEVNIIYKHLFIETSSSSITTLQIIFSYIED